MQHHIAEINHYAARTLEEYSYKKGSPAPADGADRYADNFRKTLDRNEQENLSAVSNGNRFDVEYDRLCQIPAPCGCTTCVALILSSACAKSAATTQQPTLASSFTKTWQNRYRAIEDVFGLIVIEHSSSAVWQRL